MEVCAFGTVTKCTSRIPMLAWAANEFSISGDFHLTSRPTSRARMSGRLAFPFFRQDAPCRDNFFAFGFGFDDFLLRLGTCAGTQPPVASLTCSGSNSAPVNSSKNISTWFCSHVCKSCRVILARMHWCSVTRHLAIVVSRVSALP